MGAVINSVVSTYRSRVQPIGLRVDVEPIFTRRESSDGSLEATLNLSRDGLGTEYDNLYLANIRLVNRGNRDFDKFPFGVSLSDVTHCVFVEPRSSDRHHRLVQRTDASPTEPVQELDFTLEPFNRGDVYSVLLYLVLEEDGELPSPVVVGSSQPVRFVDLPTFSETLARLASDTVLSVGPLSVALSRPLRRKAGRE